MYFPLVPRCRRRCRCCPPPKREINVKVDVLPCPCEKPPGSSSPPRRDSTRRDEKPVTGMMSKIIYKGHYNGRNHSATSTARRRYLNINSSSRYSKASNSKTEEDDLDWLRKRSNADATTQDTVRTGESKSFNYLNN